MILLELQPFCSNEDHFCNFNYFLCVESEFMVKNHHGDCVELRAHTFKTARTFGNSPFIYPKREFKILCAYAHNWCIWHIFGKLGYFWLHKNQKKT